MFKLKPKEERFYELFEESGELLNKAAETLDKIMTKPELLTELAAEINRIEHDADEVTRTIIDRMHQTMITPMDREDIFQMAQGLDDIIDVIQGSADRMLLYRAGVPKAGAKELVRLLVQATVEIKNCFAYLRNMRGNREEILRAVARINQLESDGDKIFRQEVARLFEDESDSIAVIKWKEILEHLEESLDLCEDVGDFLKGAMLKYT